LAQGSTPRRSGKKAHRHGPATAPVTVRSARSARKDSTSTETFSPGERSHDAELAKLNAESPFSTPFRSSTGARPGPTRTCDGRPARLGHRPLQPALLLLHAGGTLHLAPQS